MTGWQWLMRIDRRIIYLVIGVVLTLTVIFYRTEKSIVIPQVQQLYDAVEKAPAGAKDHKLLLLGVTFASGTMAENGNQFRAVVGIFFTRISVLPLFQLASRRGQRWGRKLLTTLQANIPE